MRTIGLANEYALSPATLPFEASERQFLSTPTFHQGDSKHSAEAMTSVSETTRLPNSARIGELQCICKESENVQDKKEITCNKITYL